MMAPSCMERAFAHWLAANGAQLPGPLTKRQPARGAAVYEFGASPFVLLHVARYGIDVSVEPDGQCWDLLYSDEVPPAASGDGVVCSLCDEPDRKVYRDDEDLLREHQFEPLFRWLIDDFARAERLELGMVPGGGATWAELKRPGEPLGSQIVANLPLNHTQTLTAFARPDPTLPS